jgi:hypothetical protein
MGMICCLAPADEDQISGLLNDPEGVSEFLEELDVEQMKNENKGAIIYFM